MRQQRVSCTKARRFSGGLFCWPARGIPWPLTSHYACCAAAAISGMYGKSSASRCHRPTQPTGVAVHWSLSGRKRSTVRNTDAAQQPEEKPRQMQLRRTEPAASQAGTVLRALRQIPLRMQSRRCVPLPRRTNQPKSRRRHCTRQRRRRAPWLRRRSIHDMHSTAAELRREKERRQDQPGDRTGDAVRRARPGARTSGCTPAQTIRRQTAGQSSLPTRWQEAPSRVPVQKILQIFCARRPCPKTVLRGHPPALHNI